MRTVAVGWYGHANRGDEAFRPAIREILQGDVVFTDCVPQDVNEYDALVFGGGSFLDQDVPSFLDPDEVEVPVAFLGVGIHETITSGNRWWLEKAAVVVARNRYPEVLQAPDLVFARELRPEFASEQRLLVLGNGFAPDLKPQGVTSVLEEYALRGWEVRLQPMMARPVFDKNDDRWANVLMSGGVGTVGLLPLSEAELLEEISRSSLVISLRYHGCVLATILERAFVGIGGHAKISSFFQDNGWNNWSATTDHDSIVEAITQSPSSDQMRQLREEGYQRWQDLSVIVRDKLFG